MPNRRMSAFKLALWVKTLPEAAPNTMTGDGALVTLPKLTCRYSAFTSQLSVHAHSSPPPYTAPVTFPEEVDVSVPREVPGKMPSLYWAWWRRLVTATPPVP